MRPPVDAQRAAWAGSAARNGTGHCDVKPGNILLFDANGTVVAKLSDFGSARTAATIASDEVPAGTYRFIAPEARIVGKVCRSVDKMDVYSWAATFVAICAATGKRSQYRAYLQRPCGNSGLVSCH